MEEETVYRLDVAYDGARFDGFQSQSSKNAIQDHLEKALTILLRHPVKVQGASRTDRGVHAQQQVCLFKTAVPFKDSWLPGINAILFNSIMAYRIEKAPLGFHPINSAVAKAYRYRLWLGFCNNPFARPYVWPIPPQLDFAQLNNDLQKLVGEKDFAAFKNADSHSRTTVRTILEAHIDHRGQMVDIWLVGTGFLKQMVRIIVGTIVDRAHGKPIMGIDELLLAKERTLAGQTAPARGLSLVEIFYGDVPKIDELIKKADRGFTFSI